MTLIGSRSCWQRSRFVMMPSLFVAVLLVFNFVSLLYSFLARTCYSLFMFQTITYKSV